MNKIKTLGEILDKNEDKLSVNLLLVLYKGNKQVKHVFSFSNDNNDLLNTRKKYWEDRDYLTEIRYSIVE